MTQSECNVQWRIDAAGSSSPRPFGLLLEITVTDSEVACDAAPLNIGLAIDRSGSMQGAPLEAAKLAASGVVDRLSPDDRVTLATFEAGVATLIAGLEMNEYNKEMAQDRIAMIRSGGTTALFDGWREAALGVAKADTGSDTRSHVVVLSDGRGNRGLTEPGGLRHHAAELSRRGIRSSCLGIGVHYFTPQLAALARGGEGVLHHASEPEEIIEIVLGEIERQRSQVADELTVTLVLPPEFSVRVCGGRHTERYEDRLSVALGAVAEGQTVRIALLFDPIEVEVPSLRIDASVCWTPASSGGQQMRSFEISLDHAEVAGGPRDHVTAGRIAALWHADLCERAMDLNDRDQFVEAVAVIRDEQRAFRSFVCDLPEGPGLLETLRRVGRRSSRPWRGLGKKEAHIKMRKLALSEPELRAGAQERDLSDFLDE